MTLTPEQQAEIDTLRAQTRQTLRATVMDADEGEEFGDIAVVGDQRVVGGPFQRALMVKPCLKGIARGGTDGECILRPAQDSQRRIVRSNTPAKKPSRSVPCCGLNICGSSEPRISRPGKRPAPKFSFRQASDRIQSAAPP